MVQVELNPGDTLCKQGDASSEIYILQDGDLDVSVRDKRGRDKVISKISGKHAVFGEFGAIMKKPRSASIRAVHHAVVQKIDTKNKALDQTILAQPKLGFSISMHLARYLKDTNLRLSQYAQFSTALRKYADACLLYYFQKTKSLGDLHEQTKLAWVKTIHDKAKSHPCFGLGDGLGRGQEPFAEDTAAAHSTPPPPPEIPAGLAEGRNFKAGETLGKESEEGRDFFILLSGTLDILVGGRKVSEVKDKGSVIGEVSVLVGYTTRRFEPRSGTIVAREDSSVIVVEASRLESLIASNPALILLIAQSLSCRLFNTNLVFLSDEERINKYLSLLDAAGPASLMGAYELLRTNLQSGGKDKAETQGYAEEVQARLADIQERASEFHEGFEGLAQKWKTI
ncbi:MAG: hypothetical protein A3G34_12950 [Candidatus Lindowbacteria bacterium RIFCSPLOWO2_12_FULL_62_27]|nr:MAG: hypothetical protein A3I06_15105 [Candidatus Lindowbacteria bacterium RIFCSPLOWO2_02_FULL_62_12]OGH62496.1 MAG: hypothetical protein A3G34_12950 [Candidatus Lindowbacteria bacterium RIFCSPLOWO2_12_FULL_62_27]